MRRIVDAGACLFVAVYFAALVGGKPITLHPGDAWWLNAVCAVIWFLIFVDRVLEGLWPAYARRVK